MHVALDLFLDLRPGDLSGVEGTILLEIFIFWVPVLFLGTYLGLGWGRRVPFPARLAILLAYAVVLATLGVLATSRPADAVGCNVDEAQAHCVAAAYFDLLFRLAPIPSFLFLFANGRHRWTVGQCFGLALATYTIWRGIYGSFPDLLLIAGGGTVTGPTPAIAFYRSFFLKTLWEMFYVLLGLFFIFRRVPGIHKPFSFGNEIERVLRPLGAWTRRTIPLDVAWGLTVFAPIAIGASLLGSLLSQGPTGGVGDDSQVYNQITFDLVFLLSIAAGVGEELVYRGFLQSALERLFVFRGWQRPAWGILGATTLVALGVGTYMTLFVDVVGGILTGIGIGVFGGVVAMCIGWGGFGIAILLQALLFGLVHSGYGDLDHIILPLMFGLLMGIVYRLFGLMATILIHVEIDIFAFSASYYGPGADPLNTVLSILFLIQIAFAIIFPLFRFLMWRESRQRVVPVLVRS